MKHSKIFTTIYDKLEMSAVCEYHKRKEEEEKLRKIKELAESKDIIDSDEILKIIGSL